MTMSEETPIAAAVAKYLKECSPEDRQRFCDDVNAFAAGIKAMNPPPAPVEAPDPFAPYSPEPKSYREALEECVEVLERAERDLKDGESIGTMKLDKNHKIERPWPGCVFRALGHARALLAEDDFGHDIPGEDA